MGAAAAPIGVFDSGLGGLTVVRALRGAVPDESLLYLGDTARVPYGTRSAETVVRYARSCSRELVARGVKALVIACNTVSAVAVEVLAAELDLPVLGVIEPGAEAAVAAAEAVGAAAGALPKIGVLGTQGTVLSGAYPRAVARLSSRLEVVAQAAPLLVPLVEEGWVEGEVPERVVERYVDPLVAEGAGVLVLGCTHYPLLAPVIARVAERLAGRPIPVVDGAAATARRVAEWIRTERLEPAPAGAAGTLELLVTDLPASFARLAESFLGRGEAPVAQIDLR
ncbi:MAG: glutamate racemase [Polyangiaceae bacterium]|nr:glutamate racemase [Polyangiaceae bacterium]